MRRILLFTACLFAINYSFSQCDEGSLDGWTFNSDELEIDYSFIDNLGTGVWAEFTVGRIYGPNYFQSQIVSDVLYDGGPQEITLESEDIVFGDEPNYFYRASMQLLYDEDCNPPVGVHDFYVSQFSLLNDPFFNPPTHFSMPLDLIGGEESFIYSQLIVDDGPGLGIINDVQFFLDLGHTNLGDLSITLVSPSETEVEILPWPNELDGYSGISAVFDDEASQHIGDQPELQGYFIPSESLEILDGEIASGLWEIWVEDHNSPLDSGMVAGFGLIFDSDECEYSLAGNVFYDGNMNGVQDDEENIYPYAMISNSLDEGLTMSDDSGDYWDCTMAGEGVVEVLNPPMYYQTESPSFEVSETNAELENVNIPLTPIPGIVDLSVSLFNASGGLTLWFDNWFHVSYSNIGTECINDVQLIVNFDDGISVSSVSNTDADIVGNDVVLDIPSICPGEQDFIEVFVDLDEGVEMGEYMSNSATITPIFGDEAPDNNEAILVEEVLSSYDPNDKWVSHEYFNQDFVNNDESMDYRIRFQNTGNFMAGRVIIVDTISEYLDLSTLQVLSASHHMELEIEGRELSFVFDNIMLPDSASDEAGSHGFVNYRIQPVDDFSPSDVITNTAYIYFDFNEPIITNTTYSGLAVTPGVPEFAFEGRVFPNPGTNDIRLDWAHDAQVERLQIFDMTGKELKAIRVGGTTQTTIDVSSLESGAYLIHFSGKESVRPVVWIKE